MDAREVSFLSGPTTNFMNKPRLFAQRLSCALFLGCALGLIGCGSRPSQESVRDTLKNEAKEAKDSFAGLQSAMAKGSELSGSDDKGRLLWSVGASEIRTQAP